jgi:nicotinate-nucleotide adenylyltransferase
MAGMRVGVLGGTFDPVHLGHLILADTVWELLSLERLLFVPSGNPWRKAGQPITPGHHRLAMVRLALEGSPFQVWTGELQRPGPSYTVDTLHELRLELPGAEFFLVMGYDSLLDLPHWHRPQEIISLAFLAVASRPGAEDEGALARVEALLPGLKSRLVWLDMPPVGISATLVRERVRVGRSIRYLVPPQVEEYIRSQGLYRQGFTADR